MPGPHVSNGTGNDPAAAPETTIMDAKEGTTTDRTKARRLADAAEAIRKRLHLETLDTRGLDRLDFHDISVASLRDAIQIAFDAGYAAATAK